MEFIVRECSSESDSESDQIATPIIDESDRTSPSTDDIEDSQAVSTENRRGFVRKWIESVSK